MKLKTKLTMVSIALTVSLYGHGLWWACGSGDIAAFALIMSVISGFSALFTWTGVMTV